MLVFAGDGVIDLAVARATAAGVMVMKGSLLTAVQAQSVPLVFTLTVFVPPLAVSVILDLRRLKTCSRRRCWLYPIR